MIDIGLYAEYFHAAGYSFIWFSYQSAQQEVPLIHRAGAVPLPPEGKVFLLQKRPAERGVSGGYQQQSEKIKD